MKNVKGTWILATLLLVWAVASTVIGSYYYMQYTKYYNFYQDLTKELKDVSISVNIAIDYGNGTRVWHNNTILPLEATVFNATVKVANPEPHPTYGESFIIAINGVSQNEAENMYWGWWIWDDTDHQWVLGPLANNEYTLRDGQSVIWYYSKAEWPPKPPE